MMDYELTLTPLLDRARKMFAAKEIVTKVGNEYARTNYENVIYRVGKLASALRELGVKPGDRVATIAWNNTRHLELYLAIPCMGAVLHPINIRLPPDQIIYIVNQAEDKVLLLDPGLIPLVEKLAPDFKYTKHYIVMGEEEPKITTLRPILAYEELLKTASPEFQWPHLHENDAAAMCYTSGTTGHPKGVVYSHRSIYLHSMGLCMADMIGISELDVFMPVVPMFHVLAWGTPYACTMVGSKQVFPGPHLMPRDLISLIQSEQVTVSAGVPTLWLGMLNYLEKEHFDLGSIRMLLSGGAATPKSMIETYQKKHNINVVHAWGMTETSPLGTICHLRSHHRELPEEERYNILAKQGSPAACIEIRAVDEQGQEVPWDGETRGELQVRGPWVAGGYYNDNSLQESFSGGWFRTGDLVTIDQEGFMEVVDRLKDLVRSGGEWISTQELEKALMDHPKVQDAAVIAVAHPKWQERPLACVVPRPEYKDIINKQELFLHLQPRFSRMYLPDDIVFVDSLPKTSVGKNNKKILREQYKGYVLPE
jgi:fatty-acyl-CoA synthase